MSIVRPLEGKGNVGWWKRVTRVYLEDAVKRKRKKKGPSVIVIRKIKL